MVQKSLKALLALGLLLPLFAQARNSCDPKRRCRDYASLVANCLTVRCSETVCGNLTVGGQLSTSGGLVSGVVPFSSGLIDVTFSGPITPTSVVMAFGSSAYTGITSSGFLVDDNVLKTAYAFTVPRAGTLHDLRVSADVVYTSTLATPVTFTFIVEKSPCIQGVPPTYTSTGLTATATSTNPGNANPLAVLIVGNSACGFNGGSVPVAAGDRVTIHVIPNISVPATLLTFATFSAGILYTPA